MFFPKEMSLSTDPKKWKETIEGTGFSCLSNPISAKNVQSTLSHATAPGAQKILCTSIIPFVSEMVKNSMGVSILTSLVRYGTPGTVEKIAAEVMRESADMWNFTSFERVLPEIIEELSNLLDGFVYRTDASGGNCDKIRQSLKKAPGSVFHNIFTLPALGRLLASDLSFCKAVSKDKSILRACGEAIRNKKMKSATKFFCENALAKEVGSEENRSASEFLFHLCAPYLKKNASERPHEGVILSVVSLGDPVVVEKIGECIKDWPNVHDMAEREGYTKILSAVLERGSKKVGPQILKRVFITESDVDKRLNSRKAPSLQLLSIIANTQPYLNAVNESIGKDQGVKLRGAAALFMKNTIPTAKGTRKLIEEKLHILQNSGVKRLRE